MDLEGLFIPIIILMIGTLASLYQLRMNALTNAIIKWNNDFRDSLSKFISLLAITKEHVLNLGSFSPEDDKESFLNLPEKVLPLEIEYNKLLLFLNEEDKLHSQVIEELAIIKIKIKELSEGRGIEFDDNESKLIALGKRIIDKNWRLTKNIFKLSTPPS